jgi:hypothetical protein
VPLYLSGSLRSLCLSFPDGDSNEYRLRQGCVEFRSNHGAWRVLDEFDVQLHFVLDTEIAKWLQTKSADGNHCWEGDSLTQLLDNLSGWSLFALAESLLQSAHAQD